MFDTYSSCKHCRCRLRSPVTTRQLASFHRVSFLLRPPARRSAGARHLAWREQLHFCVLSVCLFVLRAAGTHPGAHVLVYLKYLFRMCCSGCGVTSANAADSCAPGWTTATSPKRHLNFGFDQAAALHSFPA